MITEILLLILQLAFVLSKGTKGTTSSLLQGDAVRKYEAALNQALEANPEALEHWRAWILTVLKCPLMTLLEFFPTDLQVKILLATGHFNWCMLIEQGTWESERLLFSSLFLYVNLSIDC